MDFIKKMFGIFSTLPAFTNLFKMAARTGKVDPMETLNALSSISPGTKKVSDVAMNTVQQGGGVSDVAQKLFNVGEIEVLGQKINPKNMITDLEKAGGICSVMANILKSMPQQDPSEIVKFGEAASNTSNWGDIINHASTK